MGSDTAARRPDEPFDRLDAAGARAQLGAPDVVWIDVREPAEWQRMRIAGARLVPLNSLLIAPEERLKGVRRALFYCAQGIRSAVACEVAAAVGLEAVYNLEGGIEEWVRRGYPVES